MKKPMRPNETPHRASAEATEALLWPGRIGRNRLSRPNIAGSRGAPWAAQSAQSSS
eukprot:CAMPEP_0180015468 /NCGR_PEP_ID=MMETSP0984-20121128/18758_1 /TAXON_ID=483367 /ORGANISM="non described non described, Strain CCMP 2436" /LENGTH=55 /DNA_ID=CAMNT_0021938275 /DNA_START=535 /DNA_END=698 /DNA_ORIENTATION=-